MACVARNPATFFSTRAPSFTQWESAECHLHRVRLRSSSSSPAGGFSCLLSWTGRGFSVPIHSFRAHEGVWTLSSAGSVGAVLLLKPGVERWHLAIPFCITIAAIIAVPVGHVPHMMIPTYLPAPSAVLLFFSLRHVAGEDHVVRAGRIRGKCVLGNGHCGVSVPHPDPAPAIEVRGIIWTSLSSCIRSSGCRSLACFSSCLRSNRGDGNFPVRKDGQGNWDIPLPA